MRLGHIRRKLTTAKGGGARGRCRQYSGCTTRGTGTGIVLHDNDTTIFLLPLLHNKYFKLFLPKTTPGVGVAHIQTVSAVSHADVVIPVYHILFHR